MPRLQAYLRCARLNLRMACLALRRRWLNPGHVAASYDRLACGYDEAWLVHLRAVTDQLLAQLPEQLPDGAILDLGCGTGYTTDWLANRWPGQPLAGIDISAGMLEQAELRTPQTDFRQDDLLGFLKAQPDGSAALVLSAWAIGYSAPADVVREAARVLCPGGVFAFVVNRMDTLGPVFRAFRRTMAAFPDSVQLALWPQFPHGLAQARRWLRSNGLKVQWEDDGAAPVEPPDGAVSTFDWLLGTGVLAGFDTVLPLDSGGAEADFMRKALAAETQALRHHYIAAIARKP